MPKWDGLKPLPDHVVAQLLRVLMCIPRTADTRLLLVKRIDGRYTTARTTTTLCSEAERSDASGDTSTPAKVSGEMARWLWHWDWRDVDGRKDAEGHCGSLEVAMAQFREAWDAPGGNVISTRR